MSIIVPEFYEFQRIRDWIHCALLDDGQVVDTGHWQAMKDVPMTTTIELQNLHLSYPIPASQNALANDVLPNLPWAEDHFKERVSGEPLNPPPSHKWWPFNRGADEHKKEERFSHTYPERFWPKHADGAPWHCGQEAHHGIRYDYGDLADVIDLLAREPHTRQAFLPVWFPEDTGAHHGERVPCTLGYHFMRRNGRLHCFYPIRSCDFLRHFPDDVYMACRLVQWVINELQSDPWVGALPGTLTMTVPSFHVFEGDLPKLKRERPAAQGVHQL